MGLRQKFGRWLAGDPTEGAQAQAQADGYNGPRDGRGRPWGPGAVGGVAGRDHAIGYTVVPWQTRQTWELHRVREESRDAALKSPHLWAFSYWLQAQVVGRHYARLHFPRIDSGNRDRLADALKDLRDRWYALNAMPIGGKDETIHQLTGNLIHHRVYDGDCFILPFRAGMDRKYQFYPGDALDEQQYTVTTGQMQVAGSGGRQRALGVEVNRFGRPVAYLFAHKAEYPPFGYASFGGSTTVRRISARRVMHIRDRMGNANIVRGWPWTSAALTRLQRLDDYEEAFVRAAIIRVAIGLAVKKEADLTAMLKHVAPEAGSAAHRAIAASGIAAMADASGNPGASEEEPMPLPWQEARTAAGRTLVFEEGFEPATVQTGAPNAQEHDILKSIEYSACAALRVSPMTLMGRYSEVNFSSGQLAALQEQETVEGLQGLAADQWLQPAYEYWFLTEAWPEILLRHPRVQPEDVELLRRPQFQMKRYQILEKHRVFPEVRAAFLNGLLTYAEARREIGESAYDVDAVIAEWKEDMERLGATPEFAQGTEPPEEDDEGEDNGEGSDE